MDCMNAKKAERKKKMSMNILYNGCTPIPPGIPNSDAFWILSSFSELSRKAATAELRVILVEARRLLAMRPFRIVCTAAMSFRVSLCRDIVE